MEPMGSGDRHGDGPRGPRLTMRNPQDGGDASTVADRVSRRGFLGTTAAATGFLITHGQARSYAANEQLQVAVVGVHGRGSAFVAEEGYTSVNNIGRVAALCDVNQRRAADAFARYPDVPRYEDYRVMIDEMADRLDGVIVSTPDHTHAAPSAYALRAGVPVFCEKGLTRTVHEARALAELTAETGLSTQMGNQGGYNAEVVEHVWAGTLGGIESIHMWGGGGRATRQPPDPNGHRVPDYLNWDLWLGPAAHRAYHPDWMHWQRWRDFSSAFPGMWGAHFWATLFKAMQLDTLWPIDGQPPTAGEQRIEVTAEGPDVPDASFPHWRIVHWQIPERPGMPPLRITWYAGGGEAERRRHGVIRALFGTHPDWGDADDEVWTNWAGNLWIGTEAAMYTHGHGCARVRMMPDEKLANVGDPSQALTRPLPGRMLPGWVRGMGDGPAPMGCFSRFSGPFTEWYLLANVAALFPGETLTFDPVNCRIVDHEQADAALRPPYREGWTL